MFGETTIFYVKIWNHQTETTSKKLLFRVPSSSRCDFKIALQSGLFGVFQVQMVSTLDMGKEAKAQAVSMLFQRSFVDCLVPKTLQRGEPV